MLTKSMPLKIIPAPFARLGISVAGQRWIGLLSSTLAPPCTVGQTVCLSFAAESRHVITRR
jgi:hypothetical protein